MQIRRFIGLVFILSFSSAEFEKERSIMTTLRNNFRNAYPAGQQFGVLYLHKGSVATDPVVSYDVQNLCTDVDKSGTQKNVIRSTAASWSTNIFNPANGVTRFDPPIWPTMTPLLAEDCKNRHPNVATAGYDQSIHKPVSNAGHSEYFLLTLALKKMLQSYKQNSEGNVCPGAIFLYSYNSPCYSLPYGKYGFNCMNSIGFARKDTINVECSGTTEVPFYVGYTKKYNGKKEDWKAEKEALESVNVDVIQVP
ncbi:uncharacterized protein LOC114528868 [Dendronephthya gigantea]|uniref:uncharacterized protein LOC114528868 n=1 Tax=Dendronephthya gigantea TaxID=151771 RepID=UPI001069111D|nr:uncharacterized protein LOC114528868 [Dendronephthya gigantea]